MSLERSQACTFLSLINKVIMLGTPELERSGLEHKVLMLYRIGRIAVRLREDVPALAVLIFHIEWHEWEDHHH